MAKTCVVCAEQGPEDRFDRIAGQDVCDACVNGDTIARMCAVRGWRGSVNETIETRGSGDSQTRYEVARVALDVPGAGILQLTCGRRSSLSGLFGWLSHWLRKTTRLEVGDPLFDDNYTATSRTPEAARRLLALDGAQSAIMDLISDCVEVSIEAGCICVERAVPVDGDGPSLVAPLGRCCAEVCVLGHYMDQIAADSAPSDGSAR